VPTDEQRKIVEKAAGFGLPQEKICQLVISERTGKPVYKKTLAEAFRAELDRGMAVTITMWPSCYMTKRLVGSNCRLDVDAQPVRPLLKRLYQLFIRHPPFPRKTLERLGRLKNKYPEALERRAA